MRQSWTMQCAHLILIIAYSLLFVSCTNFTGPSAHIIDREFINQTNCFTLSNVIITNETLKSDERGGVQKQGMLALGQFEYYIKKAGLSDIIHVDKTAPVQVELPWVKKVSDLYGRNFPASTDTCSGNLFLFIQIHKGEDTFGQNTTATLVFYDTDISKPALEISYYTKWGDDAMFVKPDSYETIERAIKGVVSKAQKVFKKRIGDSGESG